jgi:predicted ATPase/class 3 adenylate cyclase
MADAVRGVRNRSGSETQLPSGTVTFLLTDVEASTRRWDVDPAAMRAALALHDAAFAQVIPRHQGHIVESGREGDSVLSVFSRGRDAVACAIELQRCLQATAWPPGNELRVRMALNTGEAEKRDDHYIGPALYRCARLLATAHGGQVVLPSATHDLVVDELPADIALRDLGVHRLKDFSRTEHVFQLLHPDLPREFPPLRSIQAHPTNLPLQLSSFIGRQEEIAEVRQLLLQHRLVTITGTGGIGKTRLAIEVARSLLEAYEDGVWLVELAPLSDPELVGLTVTAVLGLGEQPGQPTAETLTHYVSARHLLLVVDNCEHLIDASAGLIGPLLKHSPGLRVLTTSREALGVEGEAAWPLPSLSVPDKDVPVDRLLDFEAVALFAERAAAVVPGFRLTDASGPTVRHLCHRLDGIPLAIELAAAKLRVLSLEQLALRLNERFKLLTGGSRTSLPRHRTLQAAIDWSYDLLSEPERTLLRRLSVFVGGASLEAIEAICGDTGADGWDPIQLLDELTAKCLIFVDRAGEQIRYRLLETIRTYAADRLAGSADVKSTRDRHLHYFVKLAERARPELHGHSPAAWTSLLNREQDNIRAALDWAASQRDEDGLRLAVAMGTFWYRMTYFRESLEHLTQALGAVSNRATPLRSDALMEAGVMAHSAGDYRTAQAFLSDACAFYQANNDTSNLAVVKRWLGMNACTVGAGAEGLALLDESVQLSRSSNNEEALISALNSLGLYRFYLNGDRSGIPRAEVQEALRRARDRHWDFAIANTLDSLATLICDAGEFQAARSCWRECIEISLRHDFTLFPPVILEGLARLAWTEGKADQAISLFSTAERFRNEKGMSAPADVDEERVQEILLAAHRALPAAQVTAAHDRGVRMSIDEAFAYGLGQELSTKLRSAERD